MPRKKRITRKSHCHHVMFRGVNGEHIFIDDHDRIRFCLFLQESTERHGLNIHGFCLMNNHLRLIGTWRRHKCHIIKHFNSPYLIAYKYGFFVVDTLGNKWWISNKEISDMIGTLKQLEQKQAPKLKSVHESEGLYEYAKIDEFSFDL